MGQISNYTQLLNFSLLTQFNFELCVDNMFRPRDVSRYSVAVGLFHVHQHLLDRKLSVNRFKIFNSLQDTDLDLVFIAGSCLQIVACIPCVNRGNVSPLFLGSTGIASEWSRCFF